MAIHNEGYWITQLTDEQLTDIFNEVYRGDPKRYRLQSFDIFRSSNFISLRYHRQDRHTYSTICDSWVNLFDYFTSGVYTDKFYAKMISIFGKEYVEDLTNFVEDYTSNGDNNKLVNRLNRLKLNLNKIISNVEANKKEREL